VLMPNWRRMRSSLIQQLGVFETGITGRSLSPDKKSRTAARLKQMIENLDCLLEEYGSASSLYRPEVRDRVYG
jgi:hypothetical protein